MQDLNTVANGGTVATGETSRVFKCQYHEKVWVRLSGTVTDVTMQESIDNSTFATFNVDGTDQTFAASQYKLYDLPGGVFFRFSVTTGTAVDIRIAGNAITIAP